MTRNHQKPEVVLRVLVDLLLNSHSDHFGSWWRWLWWWWWWWWWLLLLLLLLPYYQCWPELTDIFSDGSEPPTAALHLYSTPRAKLLLWRFTIGSIRYWIPRVVVANPGCCICWMRFLTIDGSPIPFARRNDVRFVFPQKISHQDFRGEKLEMPWEGLRYLVWTRRKQRWLFPTSFTMVYSSLPPARRGWLNPNQNSRLDRKGFSRFYPPKISKSSKILGSCKQNNTKAIQIVRDYPGCSSQWWNGSSGGINSPGILIGIIGLFASVEDEPMNPDEPPKVNFPKYMLINNCHNLSKSPCCFMGPCIPSYGCHGHCMCWSLVLTDFFPCHVR